MKPDIAAELKIEALSREMGRIHLANRLYWSHGESASVEARAEHQYRQEQLEQVRASLVHLLVPKPRNSRALSSDIAFMRIRLTL